MNFRRNYHNSKYPAQVVHGHEDFEHIVIERIVFTHIVFGPDVRRPDYRGLLILLLLFPCLVSSGGCGKGRSGSSGGPKLSFAERTSAIDLTLVCGGPTKDYILEVNGSGVALFDYDNDGDLDIFFVNGAKFPEQRKPGVPLPSDALFRNDGDWKFTDVSKDAGIVESAWGCGVTVADVENDGDLDLFVTNYGPDELWINDGKGHFTPRGKDAGVADPRWGASAAFVDYDLDGLVDLFVVNYLEFDREQVKPRGQAACDYKGQKILCGPVGLPEGVCSLFRNKGGGLFEDVSEASGIRKRSGYGLGVAIFDYDGDRWPDIYVSADTTQNLLFHNQGGKSFTEIAMRVGVGLNDQAIAQAGMGVEFAFVRNAEHEDLFVVNYEDDNNTYYRNDGDGFFTEVTSQVGLSAPCFKYLGWGCFFVDFDYDTYLDLFIAQGHVVPQVDKAPSSPGYKQKNKLFLNRGDGKFLDVSSQAGPGFGEPECSRGAAYGDLDGDGDLDLVVSEMDSAVTLLENVGAPRGHWLAVHLEGTKSNRAAIGAIVRIESRGRVQARRIQSSTGYASHCEISPRFGLGAATSIDKLRVEWPSGLRETFDVSGVDRILRLVEGDGNTQE